MNRPTRTVLLFTLAALPIGQAHGVLLQEFLFSDPVGTNIVATSNSVASGQPWYDDVQGDLAGLATNGLGQYDTALKTNTATGDAFIDVMPDVTSGAVYGVMELTYAFDELTFDSAEPEDIRLALLSLGSVGSSTIAAEFQITRTSATELAISGNAVGAVGSGATGIPAVVLPGGLTASTPLIAVVAANLDTDIFSISFSTDSGVSFTTMGGGKLDPARNFLQVRMRLNNDLSQDNVLIDRVAISTHNPFPGALPSIPEPSCAAIALVCVGAIAAGRRRRVRR
ncbi:hypothetical protein Pla175_25400 [Pirellulimonas nuda]|uniref:PEP-CTERM protein-sorting domain-containing protein n=1 Tax=Pirellulimonas nuda TaxID=2528009 RepID=A0A518DCF9_9BACT|nr:hypothetical protein [Pirellulimonas nuda]QDU89153.1 hypothetical protein Pla175_25400 [Pirellulimonas nuda]